MNVTCDLMVYKIKQETQLFDCPSKNKFKLWTSLEYVFLYSIPVIWSEHIMLRNIPVKRGVTHLPIVWYEHVMLHSIFLNRDLLLVKIFFYFMTSNYTYNLIFLAHTYMMTE